MSGTWLTTRAWLLMLPLLVVMIAVIGWPLYDTVRLSFTNARLVGNCLIELPGHRRGTPRWVYTAHMDHPGFVANRMISRDTLRATFRGYVLGEYLPKQPVRFFNPDGEVRATVIRATSEKKSGRAQSAVLKVEKPVPPHSPGMFDQGLGRIKGRTFYCRAIDDLGGLSAALEMLDRLRKRPPACTVAVLLTRAEEEGFIGAIAAATKPKLIRKSDYLIAIETSAMQPYARQADGCIVRMVTSSLGNFCHACRPVMKPKNSSNP